MVWEQGAQTAESGHGLRTGGTNSWIRTWSENRGHKQLNQDMIWELGAQTAESGHGLRTGGTNSWSWELGVQTAESGHGLRTGGTNSWIRTWYELCQRYIIKKQKKNKNKNNPNLKQGPPTNRQTSTSKASKDTRKYSKPLAIPHAGTLTQISKTYKSDDASWHFVYRHRKPWI